MSESQKAFRLQELSKMAEYLELAKSNGSMPKRTYHKSQVCLAHDLIVEHQLLVLGTDCLRRCEPEYFKTEQPEDMKTDPLYAAIVVGLAKALVTHGLIDARRMPDFNMPLAKA